MYLFNLDEKKGVFGRLRRPNTPTLLNIEVVHEYQESHDRSSRSSRQREGKARWKPFIVPPGAPTPARA
jgi:hypothetical protein